MSMKNLFVRRMSRKCYVPSILKNVSSDEIFYLCSKALLKLNRLTYQMIIETGLYAFQCSAEELKMNELEELEYYLKMAKNKYHSLVTAVSEEFFS